MYYSVMNKLPKLRHLLADFKLQVILKSSFHSHIILSDSSVVAHRAFHTTCNKLTAPSYHRWKKNEFTNEYESLLQKHKKRMASPLILLLGSTGKIEKLTLEKANQIALSENLKLVKIEDPHNYTEGNTAVYQLMTGKQYHDEVMKQKEKDSKAAATGFKGEKTIVLSSNISEHDLDIKINHMVSWIQKKFQIKVTITGAETSSEDKIDSIMSKIEERIQECGGRVLQKTMKSGNFKCFINPPKPLSKSTSASPDKETSVTGPS